MTTKNTMNETFHEESTSVDFDLKDVEGNQDLEESETPGVFAKGATRTTANKDNQKRVEHANESDRVENASVIDVLGEWATSSTINGLPHAFDREHYNRPKRSVWICLVVASFGIMIWQISVLIAEYTKYEVQTNSHIDYPTSIAFPYVIKHKVANTVALPRSLTLLSACLPIFFRYAVMLQCATATFWTPFT
jgi:hypothetical protein